MAVSGIGETVDEVIVGKHPYEHPYGIVPCVPYRLMERKSPQVGTFDAVFPRIRYAVPSLISRARFVLRIGLDAVCRHPYWQP